MNTQLKISVVKTVVFVFAINVLTVAQVTSSSSSGRNSNKAQEIQQSEAVVNQVTDKVGILFKEGMLALKDQKRSEAGEKFNKSVEVFLFSSINKESNPRLFGCYNELIETVFRIEFPNTEPPNIRSLSSTCGWNWNNNDYLLVDEIAKIVQVTPAQINIHTNTAMITSADGKSTMPDEMLVGFNEQVFEPSPLDGMAKLQLSPEEVNAKKETWESLADKIGVDPKELRAMNGNAPYPTGKILMPKSSKSSVRVVKAKVGDTVAKIAERYGASPIEVAKFNGLYANSKLNVGHEIKIPSDTMRELPLLVPRLVSNRGITLIPVPSTRPLLKEQIILQIGDKPVSTKGGRFQVVLNYINNTFHGPYSVKYLEWSKVTQTTYIGKLYWVVSVKLRAKNAFNAYRLTVINFYIQKNKVIFSRDLSNE